MQVLHPLIRLPGTHINLEELLEEDEKEAKKAGKQGVGVNPMLNADYAAWSGGEELLMGTAVPKRLRQSYCPKTAQQVQHDLKALWNGPQGGAKDTWSRLLQAVASSASRGVTEAEELVTSLDKWKQVFKPSGFIALRNFLSRPVQLVGRVTLM